MKKLDGKRVAKKYGADFPVSKKDRDRLRIILSGMYRRCYDPNTIGFHNYGGRGIGLSEEWFNVNQGLLLYRNFFLWAYKNGYKDGYQIDRIDNNKGYSPDNCRWVTSVQNNRNKRNNKIIEFDGERMCQSECAEKYGICVYSLHSRLSSGWNLDRAIREPVTPNYKPLTLNGVTHSQAEWGRILGLNENTIKDRLSDGWSLERTLTTPLGLGGRSRLIEYKGQQKTIKQWSKESNLKYRTFLNRLSKGWTLDEIFSTPLKSIHDKRIRRGKGAVKK